MRIARSTPEKKIYVQNLILCRDSVVGSPIEIEQIISKHQKVTSTEDKEKRIIINIDKNYPDPPMNNSVLDTCYSTMEANIAQACRDYPVMHKNI